MQRRILAGLFTSAALACPSVLPAESLTLIEAMMWARDGARPVAAARAREDAGQARLKQARGYRLPTISLQEIWMRSDSPAEAFALQLNQERFSFADFVSGDPNDPAPIESATTRIEVSVPIYTGGELSNRIRQADLAAAAATDTTRWASDSAAYNAAEAYIRLAQIRERVELLERALETISAHVEAAQAYVDQGMLVRSELLRAQVERARIADLLRESQGQAEVAEANLSFQLAADPLTSWELDSLEYPGEIADDLDAWLASVDSRSDLQAARQKLDAGKLEARIHRAGLRPRFGLVARYDLVDDSLFGSHGDSSAVMAMGSIDLFSGGRHRAAASAAEAEIEAAALEIEQFLEGIRLQVRNAYETAKSTRDRHHTALAALDAAGEAERITAERFKKGVVKMLDLLDAGTARREAETRELVARADAHLALLNLALSAGRAPESVLSTIDPSRNSS